MYVEAGGSRSGMSFIIPVLLTRQGPSKIREAEGNEVYISRLSHYTLSEGKAEMLIRTVNTGAS